ncbi:hypothetical protein BJX64DRAFT_265589 [Aspergillus heterothallicus]
MCRLLSPCGLLSSTTGERTKSINQGTYNEGNQERATRAPRQGHNPDSYQHLYTICRMYRTYAMYRARRASLQNRVA